MPARSRTHDAREMLAHCFGALAHPVRLNALMMLDRRGGDQSVTQLSDDLGLPRTTVSKHLERLYVAGLVVRRRDGRMHLYALAGTGPLDILRAGHEHVTLRAAHALIDVASTRSGA